MRKYPTLWIMGIALVIAMIPTVPYGYYPAMRWVVCGACAWTALDAHRKGLESWVWCWGVMAGIYNPVFPVHANREIWTAINLATILAALIYSFKASSNDTGSGHGGTT